MEVQQIRSGVTANFEVVGVRVTSQDDHLHGIPMICRRHRIEEPGQKFELLEADDIVSDVYTVCLLANPDDVSVTMEMNLFDRSVSSREDVYIFTDNVKPMLSRHINNRGNVTQTYLLLIHMLSIRVFGDLTVIQLRLTRLLSKIEINALSTTKLCE